jgi:hypothetical protein
LSAYDGGGSGTVLIQDFRNGGMVPYPKRKVLPEGLETEVSVTETYDRFGSESFRASIDPLPDCDTVPTGKRCQLRTSKPIGSFELAAFVTCL